MKSRSWMWKELRNLGLLDLGLFLCFAAGAVAVFVGVLVVEHPVWTPVLVVGGVLLLLLVVCERWSAG